MSINIKRIDRRDLELNLVTKSREVETTIKLHGVEHTIKSNTGMADMIDNQVKIAWRVNDVMYDYISDNATDEDLDVLSTDVSSFSSAKKFIVVLEKNIEKYVLESQSIS